MRVCQFVATALALVAYSFSTFAKYIEQEEDKVAQREAEQLRFEQAEKEAEEDRMKEEEGDEDEMDQLEEVHGVVPPANTEGKWAANHRRGP